MGSAVRDDEIVVLSGAGDESNGQTLRIAVALSAMTGTPVKIEEIRALKKIPGRILPKLPYVSPWPPPLLTIVQE